MKTLMLALTAILVLRLQPVLAASSGEEGRSVETNAPAALTNSALSEMGRGGQFLATLRESGQLPGVPQNSHGSISVNAPLSALQEAKYPFTVTLDLVLEGDSMTNHYTVVRPAKDASWQLDKAWRTDTQGHTVVEWPVK